MTNLPNEQLKAAERLHLELMDDPAGFILDKWKDIEWPRFEDPETAALAVPINAWIESLMIWAEGWGRLRLAQESSPDLEHANHQWGYHRPDMFGLLEIGRHSIHHGLRLEPEMYDYLKSRGLNVPKTQHIAGVFADQWAVTDGWDIAAMVLTAELGRTEVSAFATAMPNVHRPEWYQLTGELRFHVTGDPENPDLQTFIERSRIWARIMAGYQLPRGGRKKLEITAIQIIQAFKEESMFVDATKLSVANNLDISVDTLDRRLKEFGLAWPPIDQ